MIHLPLKKQLNRIGTSRQKVEKVRTVLDRGSEDVKRKVREGKTSINRAYRETMERKAEGAKENRDATGVGPLGNKVSTQFRIAVENMLSAIRAEKVDRWRRTSKEDALSCIQNHGGRNKRRRRFEA